MTTIITAVYEKGLLRPLTPLNLPEHQTVRLQVMPDEAPRDEGAEAVRVLVAAGLMRPRPSVIPPDPVPAEERRALAERLSQAPGQSLSEIVIEDRGN